MAEQELALRRHTAVWATLAALALGAFALLPFLWVLVNACRPAEELLAPLPSIWPGTWTLENFRRLASLVDLPRHFGNSLCYAGGLTIISLVINLLAGFAFARLRFPQRERLFTLLLLTMMIPSHVTLIPMFLMLKTLGLLNSYWGLILPGAAHVFGIFLVRQFMLDLPEQLFEAARLDGCTDWELFRHIALPLAWPIVATLAILTFVTAWNEFLWPLVVIQREADYPLPIMLAMLNSQHGDQGLMSAGSVAVVLPALLLFLVAQRHYLRGITASAGK